MTQQETYTQSSLGVAFGLQFHDLYDRDGLVRLDSIFLEWLGQADPTLVERLLAGRKNPASLDRKQYSELIIALSPYLEDFVAELFGITAELRGETAPLEVEITDYEIRRDGEIFLAQIKALRTSREWLTTLAVNHLQNVPLELPAQIGGLLIHAL